MMSAKVIWGSLRGISVRVKLRRLRYGAWRCFRVLILEGLKAFACASATQGGGNGSKTIVWRDFKRRRQLPAEFEVQDGAPGKLRHNNVI